MCQCSHRTGSGRNSDRSGAARDPSAKDLAGIVALVTESERAGPDDLPVWEGPAGLEVLGGWQSPVADVVIRHVPVFLVPRLAEMAAEAPDTSLGRKIYYHQAQCLALLADSARRADLAAFRSAEPLSHPEQFLGSVLSSAFYQECSLADIMLASGLSAEQVVTIGKRVIRRRKWLRKLTELNPGLESLLADPG
jgi:hypothetical protein